uniref:EGF-like domain-containing protein n=1 Tax=Panagrellus redivivus TaxID=6233 RepID=A0A7E4VB47_PANRE
MTLFLLFLCFNGAFAFKYSLFEHRNISTLIPASDCPPLYYGENCTIPYCCPETSRLVQRKNDFFCNCAAFTTGAHCEIVDCHRGELSKITLQCECPFGIFGDHCDKKVIDYVSTLAVVFIIIALFCTIARGEDEDDKSGRVGHSDNRNTPNRNHAYWTRAPQPPAPAIQTVVHIVIHERADGPPTYDSTVRSADPPKYAV